MMKRRGVELTIGMIIGLVLALIVVIWAVYAVRNYLGLGVSKLYQCDGECLTGCPEGYEHLLAKDGSCEKGLMCCKGLTVADESGINPGDIRIYYNGDMKKPIQNGDTVTLKTASDSYGPFATGRFTVAFTKTAAGSDKRCYWQVGWDGEEMVNQFKSNDNNGPLLFEVLKKNLETITTPESTIPVTTNQMALCKDYEVSNSELRLTTNNYLMNLGRRMKFNLIVVNEKTCDATEGGQKPLSLCSPRTHTFYVEIPDRKPVISLKVNNKEVSQSTVTQLNANQQYEFEITITDPLATCSVSNAPSIGSASSLPFLEPLTIASEPNCFSKKSWVRRTGIIIPNNAVRGISFTLGINTSLSSTPTIKTLPESIIKNYTFRIAPDPRVRVDGPAPGLNRLKTVDIACNGVSCSRFEVAYLKSPLDCYKGAPTDNADFKAAQPVLYGGNSSGRFRLTIDNETNNGLYVCIKTTIDKDFVYSLGLWQQAPVPLAIDRTPPSLKVGYDPFKSILTMECADPDGTTPPVGVASNYVSGCARRPFSYTYITDPLAFATSVVTGGLLKNTFHGCNDLTPAVSWISYNSDRKEMEYVSRDVRVMCVRAMDNAGNVNITSKLLFSGQEALGLFLSTVMKATN
jgi:hypothetical protein